MKVHFRSRIASSLLALPPCLLLLGGQAVQAAPVTLDSATTEVVVHGGETNSTLQDSGGYLDYTDLVLGELVSWSVDPVLIFPDGSVRVLSNGSAGGFGSPVSVAGGAESFATVTSDDGALTIDVTAHTTLDGATASTDFTFVSRDGSMAGTTFLWYAENDLFGFADDVAAYTGSIAGDDLTLFMFDSLAVEGGAEGLTVVLDGEAGVGATLSAFGAGIWSAWGNGLEAGDLSLLSADGSNFETGPADLGLALAFDLVGVANSPYTAQLTANYSTQQSLPNLAPEPSSVLLLATGLFGIARIRRRTR